MKKLIKIILIVIVAGFAGIQFYRPARVNPKTIPSETLESVSNVPGGIKTMMQRSCNDCHTNNTDWIWYSNIAPLSWKIVDHVNLGREELNFSKWGTYAKERKLRKLEEICDEVKGGQMPHNQYLWLHWDAKISSEDVKTLCDWTVFESENLNKSADQVR